MRLCASEEDKWRRWVALFGFFVSVPGVYYSVLLHGWRSPNWGIPASMGFYFLAEFFRDISQRSWSHPAGILRNLFVASAIIFLLLDMLSH
jgi:hypothetical protein